jgi:aspartyl-tRNA(Asn)/glutamyl-tRNA(Gln) amidotransferase subunit C
MSDLNEESVKIPSRLCRMEISEAEVQDLFLKLKQVLDYVELLHEVDVSHLSPHSHIEEQSVDSLREDRIGTHLPREVMLANAPDQVGGMIRVPTIIKQQPTP